MSDLAYWLMMDLHWYREQRYLDLGIAPDGAPFWLYVRALKVAS